MAIKTGMSSSSRRLLVIELTGLRLAVDRFRLLVLGKGVMLSCEVSCSGMMVPLVPPFVTVRHNLLEELREHEELARFGPISTSK